MKFFILKFISIFGLLCLCINAKPVTIIKNNNVSTEFKDTMNKVVFEYGKGAKKSNKQINGRRYSIRLG